jgi:hypothetical protein
MVARTTGEADLRAENISKVVTGFALQSYVLKDLCTIDSSNSFLETYYAETAADLTGGLGSDVKGVPRLANFPYGEVSWTKTTSRLEKYGMEGVISYEDATTNAVDVIARTLLRIGRAVAKAVDDAIIAAVNVAAVAVATNIVTITAGFEWNSSTLANQDPISNILAAVKEIQIDNYNALNGNGYLVLNPLDYASMLSNANVRNAGQFWTDSVTANGNVGTICGLKVVVTNSATADYAYVIVAKEAMTWKEAAPLTVKTIEDPGIKTTIRAYEIGCVQIKNPLAICRIGNTQA